MPVSFSGSGAFSSADVIVLTQKRIWLTPKQHLSNLEYYIYLHRFFWNFKTNFVCRDGELKHTEYAICQGETDICGRSGSWMILSLKHRISQDWQPGIYEGQASNWIF